LTRAFPPENRGTRLEIDRPVGFRTDFPNLARPAMCTSLTMRPRPDRTFCAGRVAICGLVANRSTRSRTGRPVRDPFANGSSDLRPVKNCDTTCTECPIGPRSHRVLHCDLTGRLTRSFHPSGVGVSTPQESNSLGCGHCICYRPG